MMFHRREHALALGLALLAVAAILAVIVAADPTSPPFQSIDDRWLQWMVDIRTPWLTTLAKWMSFVGSAKVTFPLRLLVVLLLAVRQRWLQLGVFVVVVVLSELCIGPLKSVVERPRPPGTLIATTATSFPSGHAIAAATTAFGVVIVLLPASPGRLRWIGVAAAFAGLMALSRTYLAAHWLSDVIAGVCIGTGLALALPAGAELIRARLRPPGQQVDGTGSVALSPESAGAERVIADEVG
jgi:undecaprenyl-diphosphatase